MNIVTIGGGKGQSTLLRSLRSSKHDITAVVSVMDDGGSSGQLREEFDIVPPGDLRRCLAALSSDADLLDRWNARDENNHAVGNLIILEAIQKQGDAGQALLSLAKEYDVRGRVLPVSTELATLVAEYDDAATVVHGETNIDIPHHDSQLHVKQLRIEPVVQVYPGASEALGEADCVVLTMGDLYTSILPNLLVAGVTEALAESGRPIVYICNRSTKQGETHGFSSADFAREVQRYLGDAKLTHVIADDNSVPAPKGVEVVRYEERAGVKWLPTPLAVKGEPVLVAGDLAAEALLRLCESF